MSDANELRGEITMLFLHSTPGGETIFARWAPISAMPWRARASISSNRDPEKVASSPDPLHFYEFVVFGSHEIEVNSDDYFLHGRCIELFSLTSFPKAIARARLAPVIVVVRVPPSACMRRDVQIEIERAGLIWAAAVSSLPVEAEM